MFTEGPLVKIILVFSGDVVLINNSCCFYTANVSSIISEGLQQRR